MSSEKDFRFQRKFQKNYDSCSNPGLYFRISANKLLHAVIDENQRSWKTGRNRELRCCWHFFGGNLILPFSTGQYFLKHSRGTIDCEDLEVPFQKTKKRSI